MDPKEVFSDKPAIVAAIEAFEETVSRGREIPYLLLGGVAFGCPEGPRVPTILVEAYRDLPESSRIEAVFVRRKEALEAAAARNERLPAQTPLETFSELAERRVKLNLSEEETSILEEVCREIPDILRAPTTFDDSALRKRKIVI